MRVSAGRWIKGWLIALASILALGTSACTSSPGGAQPDVKDFTSLALTVEGFGPIRLGDSVDSVMDVLSARWGPVDRTSELVCESDAQSKIVNWDGVLLVFNDRGLAGYQLGPKPANTNTPVSKDVYRAATPQGLRLGDTVMEAREVYGAAFVLDETSLGPEWYVEAEVDGEPVLGGFASGLADSDTIDRIGAGDICAVR